MNIFPYSSPQMFGIPHPHSHPALYAHQQQQEANMLYHRYNQLRSMQAYSNPALASVRYGQQSLDPQQQQQQQQQQFRADQLVPQSSPQIPTPVQQLQQQLQQQMIQQQSPPAISLQRSSPINMLQMSPGDPWLAGGSLPNSDLLRPIARSVSRSMLETVPYTNGNNSVGSNSGSPMSLSYESPKTKRHSHSKQNSQHSLDNRRRRQRLHSGSSCYESDSTNLTSNDEEEFEWRPASSKVVANLSSSSRNRSNSMGRTDLSNKNEQFSSDIYQTSVHNNGLLPAINPAAVSNVNQHSSSRNTTGSPSKLLQYINDNVIGKDHVFTGPWGPRRMLYCDYVASGRSLHFIEHYIKTHVLPLYANTHSEYSLCAQQTNKFREEARNLIKKSVNASQDDVVIFTGSGSTGAIHKLVDHFNLTDEDVRKKTVVIISAFEHHSNILPWQETGVELVRIPTTNHGILDKALLRNKLQHYATLKKQIICSLNAASNISGIRTDVDAISALVHMYSGLIFWDYASAAPYTKIDMNTSSLAYKDAIFISTHKFVGGPGTPGILIAKKDLFRKRVPNGCGGGTVNFVTRECREYNQDIETREEGGTPDIIGCIRAGLVFQLKDAIGDAYLEAREEELVKRFYRRFRKSETLIVLGSSTVLRLPIFSFLIYVPSICKYLHHNFVCLLLNDLFGIQVRSGCACAGPYALDLLNIDDAKTNIYCMFMTEEACNRVDKDNLMVERTLMMRPGFTRLNLPYFASDDEIEYVLNAVQFIASDGWKFLPLYTYEPATAAWRHRDGYKSAHSSLENITYKAGKMQQYASRKDVSPSRADKGLHDPLREAKLLAANALQRALESIDYTGDPPMTVPDKYSNLIWFALPIDIALMMFKQQETGQEAQCNRDLIPFVPAEWKEKLSLMKQYRRDERDELVRNERRLSGDLSSNRKKHTSSRASSMFRVRS